MTELLPCPFCGARAMRVESSVSEFPFIVCENNHAWCPRLDTKAEAIAAWNTRAQTVFGMTLDEVRQMMKRDAERERTYKIEQRIDGWGAVTRHCGNCGADLDCDTRNRQNYCPNCGAKVVE